MYINFTISGNASDFYGEVEPQKKDWASHVRRSFYEQFKLNNTSVNVTDSLAESLNTNRSYAVRPAIPNSKPINVRNTPIRIWLDIEWGQNMGNAGAVFNSVIDALTDFQKTLKSGHFESRMSEDGKGKVNVIIRIE